MIALFSASSSDFRCVEQSRRKNWPHAWLWKSSESPADSGFDPCDKFTAAQQHSRVHCKTN